MHNIKLYFTYDQTVYTKQTALNMRNYSCLQLRRVFAFVLDWNPGFENARVRYFMFPRHDELLQMNLYILQTVHEYEILQTAYIHNYYKLQVKAYVPKRIS